MIALARIRKATAPKFPPLSSQERAIKNAILAATDRIVNATTLAEVRSALDANDVDAAIEAIRVDQGEAFLRSILPQQFRAAYEIVGGATALETSRMLGIGYSFDILTPSAVDWVRQNAGSLIRQWGDSSRDALAKLIADGFKNRLPAATLARRVLDTGIGLTWRQARAVLNMRRRLERDGVAADIVQGRAERYFKRLLRDRAEMIARTEIMRAAVNARLESWRQAAAQGLLDPTRLEMEWLATGDARVCPDCADLDGTRAKAPDGHFLSDSGTDGGVGPPFHPRCLPGHTLVAASTRIAAVSERWFDGELVVIETASGNKLSCTPNHPILTRRGWIAAGALHIGDHVICRRVSERLNFGDPQHKQVPTRIQDVANAFRASADVTAMPVPTSAEDFHGDGEGSQVAVIWTYGLLRDSLQATGTEGLGYPSLKRRGAYSESLSGLRDPNAMLLADRLAANSLMRGFHLCRASLAAHLRPLQEFSGRTSAQRDAFAEKSGVNYVSTDAELARELGYRLPGTIQSNESRFINGDSTAGPDTAFVKGAVNDLPRADAKLARDLANGLAGPVFADDIVSINVDAFHGIVYNLETEGGWYAAEGIITHNCRCRLVLVPVGSQKMPRARVNIPGDTGRRPRRR